MFFAHLPAGYLIGRAILRRVPENRGTWILTAAMVGGLFPDLDLVYLEWLERTSRHHHTYWTHLPVAWLGAGLFAAITSRHRDRAFRLGVFAFMLGGMSHLVLDSFIGDIWWLYPISGQPFSLENLFQPWRTDFILNLTMLCELFIVAAAAWLEIKSPRIFTRIRLARPVAALGLLAAALVLLETYWPAPALAQPVQGATSRDWNPKSFWHPHWGASGVHKGIDIFARRGTPVQASEKGLVVFEGEFRQGGNVVLVLSPRGWLHYYAHLDGTLTRAGAWVGRREVIGSVGTSGNASGKPAHLHYAIFSLIPRPLAYRPVEQGWKRLFYRDPGKLIRQSASLWSPLPVAG